MTMERKSTTAALALGFGLAMAGLATTAGGASAQLTDAEIGPTIERISTLVDADANRIKDIFKDIHEHPELGFMETRTAGIVARELEALGYEVQSGIGGTGVE